MITIPIQNILPKGITFDQYHPNKYDMVIAKDRYGKESIVKIMGYNNKRQQVRLGLGKNTTNLEKVENMAKKNDIFEIGDLVMISSSNQIGTILDIDGEIATIDINDELVDEEMSKITSLMC
jgi:hypothetical protein